MRGMRGKPVATALPAAVAVAAALLLASCGNSGSAPPPARPASDMGLERLLDPQDRAMARAAFDDALENKRVGEQALWRNRDSGNSGTMTPTRVFQDAQGHPCRDVEHIFEYERHIDRAVGAACRQPDGTWVMQDGRS